MKILVTGGAGFIGSHTTVELHQAGHEVVIVDNFSNSEESIISRIDQILSHSIRYYQADCGDRQALRIIIEREQIEGIIHFAAHKSVDESVRHPLAYYENNLGSTMAILDVMHQCGIMHLVFSSSCTVYGQPQTIPVTETTPRQTATSPYGNTKVICEDMIRDAVLANTSIKSISLRYFNPIGAHPRGLLGELPRGVPVNLVPYLAQTAAGLREKLVIYGTDYDTPDGSCIRDYIHVVDLAQAHVAALNQLCRLERTGYYEVFNVGTGQGHTVLELIETFEQVNQVKLPYEIGPRRAGDIEKIYGNVDKAATILGWQARKRLAEAQADAWRWQQTLSR